MNHEKDESGAAGDAIGADSSASAPRQATRKPDGLGEDGTIPSHPDGVAAGHSGEKSTFEPEEDDTAE